MDDVGWFVKKISKIARNEILRDLHTEDEDARFSSVAANLRDTVKEILPSTHEDDILPIAQLLAPLFVGMPKSFNPRTVLRKLTNASLMKLVGRFGDGYPGDLCTMEQLYRDKKVRDWDFRREGATKGDVLVTCNEPVKFVTIKFKV